MKKLFVVFTLLLAGVVFAFFADRSVSAQSSCDGPIYCTGPCDVLWPSPNNCACATMICREYSVVFDLVTCNAAGCPIIFNPDPHGLNYCEDCTVCSSTTETFTCPDHLNPCINICGGPTPTPGPGPTPTPTPTPPPSCTVDLIPSSADVSMGSPLSLIASVVPQDGTVDSVNFISDNETVVTVDPASDNSSPYVTDATGVAIGSANVVAAVIMGGVNRCTDTSAINITSPGPWWQVQDADIITNGNLSSLIPTTTCLLPGCNPIFDLDGPGGYPGVPSYGGSYDFEMGSGTGTVSSTGWLANSMTTLNKVYDYSYFEGLVRPDVEINEIIEPEIQGGYLIFQGNATRDYVWFKKQGDLTITGTANLQDRKVVLLVDGDLYLGRPPAQSGSSIRVRDGSGFFMAIVSGDIIISPKAKIDPLTPQPVFEGIFLAEGQIKTGTEGPELDEQLWIRGSVAAYGGVVLERDLTDNSLTPAEFFEYGPDLLFTFPRDLTSRRYKWKEIAP